MLFSSFESIELDEYLFPLLSLAPIGGTVWVHEHSYVHGVLCSISFSVGELTYSDVVFFPDIALSSMWLLNMWSREDRAS